MGILVKAQNWKSREVSQAQNPKIALVIEIQTSRDLVGDRDKSKGKCSYDCNKTTVIDTAQQYEGI